MKHENDAQDLRDLLKATAPIEPDLPPADRALAVRGRAAALRRRNRFIFTGLALVVVAAGGAVPFMISDGEPENPGVAAAPRPLAASCPDPPAAMARLQSDPDTYEGEFTDFEPTSGVVCYLPDPLGAPVYTQTQGSLTAEQIEVLVRDIDSRTTAAPRDLFGCIDTGPSRVVVLTDGAARLSFSDTDCRGDFIWKQGLWTPSEQAEDVLTAALSETGPGTTGDAAVWFLPRGAQVADTTTTLTVEVQRLGCNNGVTGKVLEPAVEYGESDVIVTFQVETDLDGGDCPSNRAVEFQLLLDQPLNGRQLIDGQCLPGQEAATTSHCGRSGGVRWPRQ